MAKHVNWKMIEHGEGVRQLGEVDGHLVIDLGDENTYLFEPLEAFNLGLMLGRANERVMMRDDIRYSDG